MLAIDIWKSKCTYGELRAIVQFLSDARSPVYGCHEQDWKRNTVSTYEDQPSAAEDPALTVRQIALPGGI